MNVCTIDATREPFLSYSFCGGIEKTKDLLTKNKLEGYPSTHRFPLSFFVVFTRQLGLPGKRVTLSAC